MNQRGENLPWPIELIVVEVESELQCQLRLGLYSKSQPSLTIARTQYLPILLAGPYSVPVLKEYEDIKGSVLPSYPTPD